MARMIATHEPKLIPLSKQPLSIGERFRANVRRLMERDNVTQQTLADRITKLGAPTSRATLGLLLISESFPSSRWFELMARALDVDESELLAAIDE